MNEMNDKIWRRRHHLSEVLERQQDSERDKSSSLRFRGNRSASVDAAPIQHSRNATRSRRHSSAEEESYSSAFNSDLMNQFMIGPDGLVFMPDSDENSDEYISQLNVLFEHLDRFQNQHNQDTSSEAVSSFMACYELCRKHLSRCLQNSLVYYANTSSMYQCLICMMIIRSFFLCRELLFLHMVIIPWTHQQQIIFYISCNLRESILRHHLNHRMSQSQILSHDHSNQEKIYLKLQ